MFRNDGKKPSTLKPSLRSTGCCGNPPNRHCNVKSVATIDETVFAKHEELLQSKKPSLRSTSAVAIQ